MNCGQNSYKKIELAQPCILQMEKLELSVGKGFGLGARDRQDSVLMLGAQPPGGHLSEHRLNTISLSNSCPTLLPGQSGKNPVLCSEALGVGVGEASGKGVVTEPSPSSPCLLSLPALLRGSEVN